MRVQAETAVPLSGSSEIRVDFLQGREVVSALEKEWDADLARGGTLSPFASHGWLRVWLDAFAPQGDVHVARAARGGEALGFAPFLRDRVRLDGLPFTRWRLPANEHSQRCDWALGPHAEDAISAIWKRVRQEPDWDVLLLSNIVSGGQLDAVLGERAAADGFLVRREPSLQSPWLFVRPTSELESNLSSKFLANLRRRRRKLEAEAGGPVRLRRAEGGDGLAAVLQAGLSLESGGWKGEAGTAITSKPETTLFYSALAKLFAQRRWLSLYLLEAGDRPVAFHYAFTHGGNYYLLKPGYDETLGACSPGQLLVQSVLEDLAPRGVKVFDFMGPSMPWKLDWTRELRSHVVLWIIRPSFKGRLLDARRFRWGPPLKRWLKERLRWNR